VPVVAGDAEAPHLEPHDDPAFAAMTTNARAAGTQVKTHQPGAVGATAAQGAAVPPSGDVASQAAAAQLDEMAAQPPGAYDRAAFMNAVRKAIDRAAPSTLEDVDDFKSSGKAAQVKDEVGGLIRTGKQGAEQDIKAATVAPPDTSKATPKPVTPLAEEQPGAPPGPIGAAGAMPRPRPADETDLSSGPDQVGAVWEENRITEEQIEESNEPDFTAALDARRRVGENAKTAPPAYREQEQSLLAQTRDEADATAALQTRGMHDDRLKALAKVSGHKATAKGVDEAKRAKTAADVQAIFERTKTDVTATLDGLDTKVESAFTRGEAAARKQFEDDVAAKMDAYKDDRYSGWFGWARWLDDKLTGLPDEVNAFYVQGRKDYVERMDAVIGEVADIVAEGLTSARTRIADGRAEAHAYVVQLPTELREVGNEAEQKLDAQFESLEADVDGKEGEIVDTLAQKYVRARDELDKRIEELKDDNKGLIDAAIDFAKGIAQAIGRLKDLLFTVIKKAVSVIWDILAHPIKFVENLGEAFDTGFSNFMGKIGTHLQEGVIGWLMGTMKGIVGDLPATWDLAGVFELVARVLGLSYANIRDRLARVLGPQVVDVLERQVELFALLAKKDIGALFDRVVAMLGNVEELILGPIKTFVIERVVQAGVPTLLAMLNPATAFIRACIAIYDFFRFLIDRGEEIVEFVDRLLDSIGAIASGDPKGAGAYIENTLTRGLELAISLLASVMRLGSLPEKVRGIIDTIQRPIRKAIDTIIMGAVKGAKHLFAKPAGKAKAFYAKAKAKVLGGDDTPEGKQQRLDAGVGAAVRATNALPGRFAGHGVLTALFAPIRLRYGMTKLVPVREGDRWAVDGEVNPRRKKTTDKEPDPAEAETTAEPAPAAEPLDAAVVRKKNKAKERAKAIVAEIKSLTGSARSTVAKVLKKSAALRRLGAGGETIVENAEALRTKLAERLQADAALMKLPTARDPKDELALLEKRIPELEAAEQTAIPLGKKASGLEQGRKALQGERDDPKALAIARITAQLKGARSAWREEKVVAYVAKNPTIRADLAAVGGALPGLDAPEADVGAWLASLGGRDRGQLRELVGLATALQRRVLDVRTDARRPPLDEQKKRAAARYAGPEELRLVPAGSELPEQLCAIIDEAQQTLFENNKPTGKLAEKSTQFAALAEYVTGGMLRELGGTDHRGKNDDNLRAYTMHKTRIARLVEPWPQERERTERARGILDEQAGQCASVQVFEHDIAGLGPSDPYPYPDWVSEQGRADLERRRRARATAPAR
jgi:hypothetical protein